MVYLWAIFLFTFLYTVPIQPEKDKKNERIEQEKITNVEVFNKAIEVPKSK